MMGFQLGDLLEQIEKQEIINATTIKQQAHSYTLTLEYEKDRDGKPICSRICKVKIEGLSTHFFIEEEVRPYSRRDNLLAHQSYWDKPLFKVFYRKLLNDIPRKSIFYTSSNQEIESWEKACEKLGISNAFLLKVKG